MTIAFRKVREPFGWMSNMSPHPIGEWRTAEALFQAMRFTDPAIREEIRAERSPMGAKMVAKKHAAKMDVVPRSSTDLTLMKAVLLLKIQAHPELKDQLLATGFEEIVEDVTARPNESGLFWGAAKGPDGQWHGTNTLGKMWMELREALRQGTVPP